MNVINQNNEINIDEKTVANAKKSINRMIEFEDKYYQKNQEGFIMAGHSKWANIQHRKKAQDNKRGKVFTKIIKEITVAVKLAGPDINKQFKIETCNDKSKQK